MFTFCNGNKISHDMIMLLTQSYNTNLGIGVAFCLKRDLLLLNTQKNGKAAFTHVVGSSSFMFSFFCVSSE